MLERSEAGTRTLVFLAPTSAEKKSPPHLCPLLIFLHASEFIGEWALGKCHKICKCKTLLFLSEAVGSYTEATDENSLMTRCCIYISVFVNRISHVAFSNSSSKSPITLLQRDNFLPQDEHLEEFGGKHFRGHTKNSESDALSLIRLSAVVKA